MAAMRRHPLVVFFVLAYAFSWWPWPLYALGLAPGYIIGLGPFLAALVVLVLTHGRAGILGLLQLRVAPARHLCLPQVVPTIAGAWRGAR